MTDKNQALIEKETLEEENIHNASKSEKMRIQMKKWTSFYRLNMHRFVEHYLGLELHLFQKILIFFMNLNIFFVLIASRGLNDSPLIQ